MFRSGVEEALLNAPLAVALCDEALRFTRTAVSVSRYTTYAPSPGVVQCFMAIRRGLRRSTRSRSVQGMRSEKACRVIRSEVCEFEVCSKLLYEYWSRIFARFILRGVGDKTFRGGRGQSEACRSSAVQSAQLIINPVRHASTRRRRMLFLGFSRPPLALRGVMSNHVTIILYISHTVLILSLQNNVQSKFHVYLLFGTLYR